MDVLVFALCGFVASITSIFSGLVGFSVSSTRETGKMASVIFLFVGVMGLIVSLGLLVYAMVAG